jgi:hypothetical protein
LRLGDYTNGQQGSQQAGAEQTASGARQMGG